MNVLLVGSGAREHALAWRLASSPSLTELHAAPGNPGIAALGRLPSGAADDGDGLLGLAVTLGIDLVVIGPEAPLVAGVADELRRNGIAVFGPSARGGADRGLEDVREGGDAGGGRPGGGRTLGRAAALRGEGRRPRGGQGRVRVPHREGARGGAAGRRASAAAW